MSNLTASAIWDNVYQLETSDPVLGGVGGIDNQQAQNLANRTEWLKTHIGIETRFSDKLVITANATITTADIGKVIVVIASDNLTLTIDLQRNFDPFSVIKIRVICVPNKCVKIIPSAGEQIDFGASQENELYLLDGEFLNLVTNSTLAGSVETGRFILDGCSDALFNVGEEIKSKAVLHNTHKQAGDEVLRADFARIWKWVQANCVDGQSLVTDAVWLGTQSVTLDGITAAVTPYKGCWSKGDGSTTFRFPDDRGMFERILDDGRGIDAGRLWNYPGGFEMDRVKTHNHGFKLFTSSGGATTAPAAATGNTITNVQDVELAGGPENIVKNIAKYSLVRL